MATIPLFAAEMVLDFRALRQRAAWTPHWGVAALGVLPVLGMFRKWVAVLSIPLAIGSLVGLLVVRLTFMPLIALAYVLRRRQAIP